MRLITRMASAAILLLFGAAGCADLEVTNPNDPDREKALATAGDVESLIAGSYNAWFNGNFNTNTFGLSKASFESAATAANFGNLDVSGIPRQALPNNASYADLGTVIERMWVRSYRALAAVGDGVRTLDEKPELATELGAEREARARTWGKFVQALSHATLALFYDQAFLLDETVDISQPQTPVPWDQVATRAYALFDEAIAGATGASWVIPAGWIGTQADVSADQIVELAHSYRALFRASMPRLPSDPVDWDAVIADLDNGLTSDFMFYPDYQSGEFYDGAFDYGGGANGWAADTYFIIGMADQSGRYQNWLSRPVADRLPYFGATSSDNPFIIETPDTRFPQGTTLAAQIANPGEYYVIPTEDTWDYSYSEHMTLPGRGTWRWSYYYYPSSFDYWFSTDFNVPLIKFAELNLLRAEALLASGDAAGAAAIVDVTRTAHGLDASGDGNGECVPMLPDGSCGDLMEMLKWEKRLETRGQGGLFRISWYWDARRWGDHYLGTPLQFPIPVSDLQTLQMPSYTFGGAQSFGAPGSSYAWPGEN